MMEGTLGPRLHAPLLGPGWKVRFREDLKRCIVFFGYEDSRPGKGGIECIGTAFLLEHQGLGYLVTAQHLTHTLGNDPFLLRLNKTDGTSENVHVDQAQWFTHPDPTVDLSLRPVIIDPAQGYDAIFMGFESLSLTREQFQEEGIGVGDFTYTLGLFRLMSGAARNLPVCHVGNIAAFPTERIPLLDWRDPTGKTIMTVESFLVESQSLGGLSGSPVLVRPMTIVDPQAAFGFTPPSSVRPKESKAILWPKAALRLLGVWQGAWVAPPDQIKAIQAGAKGDVKVPVGMGLVVPSYKILELLDMPEVKQNREETLSQVQFDIVELQAARSSRASPASEGDANPRHREDFTSLLNAAAKTKPQDGQT